MKRSPALRELSRDHHQALRVSQRLRRADDAGVAAAVFQKFWDQDGAAHFQVEEEVLLPLWGLLGNLDATASARVAEEHLAIRIAALRVGTGDTSLDQLRALGEQLSSHVRFEERELFSMIEADLDEGALERLATAVSHAEHPR